MAGNTRGRSNEPATRQTGSSVKNYVGWDPRAQRPGRTVQDRRMAAARARSSSIGTVVSQSMQASVTLWP